MKQLDKPMHRRVKVMVYLITLAAAFVAEILSPQGQFAANLSQAIAVGLPVLLAAEGAMDFRGVKKDA